MGGTPFMHVVIVGGGIAGLSAGYRLSQGGHRVTVFEREPELGGLARSFRLGDHYLERYYHFICLNDDPLLELVDELGLSARLHWVNTGMGQYFEDVLYPFGEPWDLLTFAPFNLWEKLRFGWNIMAVKRQPRDGWRELEHVTAPDWLVNTFGRRAFEVVHKPLIELKFGEYAHRLSAAWIWARFHRIGKSRTRWTQREKLGYLEGGMHTLVSRLAREIEARQGTIYTGAAVEKIVVEDGAVRGVTYNSRYVPADAVISTVPSVVLLTLLDHPRDAYFDVLSQINYIGVMCALLRLKRSFSRYFWTNINDPRIPLAGVIEYTNLNPLSEWGGGHIVYLPLYLPAASARYRVDDAQLLEEYVRYLRIVRPDFSADWIEDWFVFRDEYAQPICEVGFTRYIPPITSSLRGLFVTDSSQLHPEDRTVANSIDLGRRAATLVEQELPTSCDAANRERVAT